MDSKTTFILVPVYKEQDKLNILIHSFSYIKDINYKIIIINGNPGDETTVALKKLNDKRLIEVMGHPGLFWSGLINRGLDYVIKHEKNQEFVILMNADVEFSRDILTSMISIARENPKAQLGAVTLVGKNVVSSGVKVCSWLFTINKHPLAGTNVESLPQNKLIAVDFLPTRCTLIPFDAVRQAKYTSETKLPHYGADYEYTNRIRKCGWQPYIFTGTQVQLDALNTGNSVFHKKLTIKTRLLTLFSIKSASNPIYRLRFIRLTYPYYAWPSAMLLYILRTFFEVLFGGDIIKKMFARKESGFSGS